MAVHAQHPSSLLLFNRKESLERNKSMEQQQPLFLLPNGSSGTRKRGRDAATTVPLPESSQANLPLSFHHHPDHQQQKQQSSNGTPLNGTSQEQQPISSAVVSTGLRLSNDRTDIAALLKHQMEEIDRLLIHVQGEQLRRAVAEERRRHLRAVVAAAARRVREKEAELELAARRNAELEERVARLVGESAAWQAKARAKEAAAAALLAHLRHAGDDAGSSCADPRRPPAAASLTCRRCAAAPAVVVLLPCRHLCLCRGCVSAAESCPVCSCVRSAGVEVYLS